MEYTGEGKIEKTLFLVGKVTFVTLYQIKHLNKGDHEYSYRNEVQDDVLRNFLP